MNQILAVENKKRNKGTRGPAEIRSIIKFFSVMIIIFGIALIGEGSYAIYEDKGIQSLEDAPTVTIGRINDEAIINITHDIPISKMVYRWNDGEETVVPINALTAEERIRLVSYNSILNIMLEDVTGKQVNYSREYLLEGMDITKPKISTNANDGEKTMTITVTDETAVKTLTYQWEDEEPVVINAGGVKEFKHDINLTPGTRKITITAEDENGNIEKYTNTIIATASEPVIKVQLLQGGKFYVLVSDEAGVSSIEINLNGQVLSANNINMKEMQTGQLSLQESNNIISIKVTNVNGYTKTATTEIKYPYEY